MTTQKQHFRRLLITGWQQRASVYDSYFQLRYDVALPLVSQQLHHIISIFNKN